MVQLTEEERETIRFEKYFFYIIITIVLIGLIALIVTAQDCSEGGYYKKDWDTCPIIASISNSTGPITSCTDPVIHLFYPFDSTSATNYSIATEIPNVGQYWIYTPNLTTSGVYSVFFNCTQGDNVYSASRLIEVVELLPNEKFENLTVGQQRILDDLNATLQNIEYNISLIILNATTTYNELITAKNDIAAIRNATDSIDKVVNTTYTDMGTNFTGIYTQLNGMEMNITLALVNMTGDVLPRLTTLQGVINDVDANLNTTFSILGANFSSLFVDLNALQASIETNFTLTLNRLSEMQAGSDANFTIALNRLSEMQTGLASNFTDLQSNFTDVITLLNAIWGDLGSNFTASNALVQAIYADMGLNFTETRSQISEMETGMDANFTMTLNRLAELQNGMASNFTDTTNSLTNLINTARSELGDNFTASNALLQAIYGDLGVNFTETNNIILAVNQSLFDINISIGNIEGDTKSILSQIASGISIDPARFDGIDGNLTEIFNDTDYIYTEMNCTAIPATSEQLCGYVVNLTSLGVVIDANIQSARDILGIVRDQQSNEFQADIEWVRKPPVFGLNERDAIIFFITTKNGAGESQDVDSSLVSIFDSKSDTLIINVTNEQRLNRRGEIPGHYMFQIDPDIEKGEYRVRVRAETVNTTTYTWSSFSIVNKTEMQQIEENISLLHDMQVWLETLATNIKGWFNNILWGA